MNSLNNDIPDALPIPLKGHEGINRYRDKLTNIATAKILPGELYVTKEDEIIVTVLGSCVSACIRDEVFGIGGMNHFMLPLSSDNSGGSETGLATRYGNFAMEQLINEILKNGGMRENLQVKIFGGGKVLKNMTQLDIGNRNISFVKEYIQMEGLKLLAEDVGDNFPRKVHYHPLTGKVRMKKLMSMHNRTILDREEKYLLEIAKEPATTDIELF